MKPISRPFIWAAFLLFFLANSSANNSQLSKLKARLERNPDNIKILSQIAQILAQTKNSEQKLIDLLNPYENEIPIKTQLILAKSYSHLKQFKNEIRVLEKILTHVPNSYTTCLTLGHAYLNAGDVNKAISNFRKATQINHKYKEAYEALLGIFEKSNNNYESRIVLQDMIKQLGKNSASSYSHLCRLDSTDGYLKAAIKNCKKAIKLNPKHPDNHVYLAQSLSNQKNESKARKVLTQASKKYPKSELVQWATGQYYFRKNNFSIASKYFSQAISANDKSARAHLGFALSTFEQKQYDKALQAFAKSCETDESTLEKLRKALGKLRTEKKMDWSKRYSRQIYECKKKRNRRHSNYYPHKFGR